MHGTDKGNELNDLPEPLVSADVDLKGFPGFVLDVEALLASELVALATPDEISAALMLWCRAWQQTPPGSLPNDERVLAAFSKAKNWKKVRDMALRGFVLCNDGRLYHKFLCKQVLEAWKRRIEYTKKREKDAERLREWRDKKQGGNAPRNADETRFNAATKSVRSEVNRSEVTTTSVPSGTDADASDGLNPVDALFQIATPWLVDQGVPDKSARSLLGAARKQLGDEAAWELASECMREQPHEPASWIAAAINARMKVKAIGGKSALKAENFDAVDYGQSGKL